MHLKALGKHGWSVIGVLLTLPAAGPVCAAPGGPVIPAVEIAIGNPLPNTLVGGRISLGVAYNTGMGRISAFTIFVDDNIHASRPCVAMGRRGIQYLELDTRSLPDGNHTVKIVAMGARGIVASDTVELIVRNGAQGGPDLTPPLVQFRHLSDGDTVSGKINLDLLTEDNTTADLLVSIFVNKFPTLLKNRPPYFLELDTAKFLNPATGTGTIRLEAWAYDHSENLGKARPITLNVVPAGASDNQTRKQDDPTRPIVSRPRLPDTAPGAAPEPARAPAEGSLIIPLGPRGQATSPRVEPAPPATAAAPATPGRARLTPGVITPGSKPLGSRAAKSAVRPVDPDFAPVGSAGRSALAAGKTALPFTSARSTPLPIPRPHAAGPDAVAAAPTAPSLSGARTALPGAPSQTVKPAPAPRREPAAPRTVTVRTLDKPAANGPRMSAPPVRPSQVASAATARGADSARLNPESGLVVPVQGPGGVRAVEPASEGGHDMVVIPLPGTNPLLSPDGMRTAVPPAPAAGTRQARAPKVDPVIVVVDPTAVPDANGKVRATVYRTKPSQPSAPKDQSYRFRPGDTLEGVARKFKVSAKAIQLANAITRPSTLRAGSVVRVPGTFDVMVNNQRVAFDVRPRVENGIPLAPFRQIFEHAGGVVFYYPETREVKASSEQREVKVKIGSKEAVVNQVIVVMDREAYIDSGRTIVPISFMEKALDLHAEYDVKAGTISLARR